MSVRIPDETLREIKNSQRKHRNLSGMHAVARATPGTPDHEEETHNFTVRLLETVFGARVVP